MNRYKIEGGAPLFGSIDVHGSKNAALPILAATIINCGKSVIHNCPNLSDVESILDILKILGCNVQRTCTDVCVDSSEFRYCDIPLCEMVRTRSSTMFAGALLARSKRACISGSGGCCIGSRPIDIHLKAFQCLGVDVCCSSSGIECFGKHLHPGRVVLDFPSVGATENIMLLASGIKGETTIFNAAREPEIINLAEYLISIGAEIIGAGSDCIRIRGVRELCDGEVSVIPDRIVAATYASAVAAAGGKVRICGINPSHLSSVIALYRKMGMKIKCAKHYFEIEKKERCKNIPYISTCPYPGFPTDCQPLAVSVMSVASGSGSVRERIFENRFYHCEQLRKMGADITVSGRNITVRGVKKINGCELVSGDLRCGAALTVAAIAAEGISYVSETRYIDRGYEDLCRDFSGLGAMIERVE